MSKRKPLRRPDVAKVDGQTFLKYGNYFTEPEVEELVRRFQLNPDFPLHQRLEDAASFYFRDRYMPGELDTKTERKTLRGAATHARRLHASLEKIPGRRRATIQSATGISASDWLRLLNRIAIVLAREKERDPEKADSREKPTQPRIWLVQNLRGIYRQAGGQGNDGYRDSRNNCFRGALVDFIEAVCELAGIKEDNLKIGRAVVGTKEPPPK
jgi:hypothetical protein